MLHCTRVEASFPSVDERKPDMHEPDFWTNCADAMELGIEGERLIVREVGDLVRDLWHRLTHALATLTQAGGVHRPPV